MESFNAIGRIMKINKPLKVSLGIITLLLIIWFSLPYYLRKALIFQNVGIEDYKIFYNRTVKAASPLPWVKHSEYNKKEISDSTLQYFRQYETIAFLVVQNHQLIHEEYWDAFSDSSVSNSFSMAKSIVALLIGCLKDEGKINSLEQPAGDFISSFKKPGYNRIKINHLLTMSSGLNWDEAYSSAFSITTKAYYGKNLNELVTNLKIAEAPGKVFRYKSCDTQLLSIIIENASGKSLAQYASEKLWQPLGAEHDAYWCLDEKDGNEKAYCCFNSNARDFARIGQLVLDSGQCNGNQLISKDYLKEATSAASWLTDEKGAVCDWYGYQFWKLTYKGLQINYARGILGQYIFIIPEKKLIVVRLGHKRSDVKQGNVPEDVFIYLDAALHLAMDQQQKI
jgi:CubicO group peptidase (beta-lactamase class C family)